MRYIYGYRNFRTEIIVTICLMTIAFATVSTTLIIKGAANIEQEREPVKVYFSDAKVVKDDNDDSGSSSGGSSEGDYSDDTKEDVIIKSENHLAFSTVIRSTKDIYNLDYSITNDSDEREVRIDVICSSQSKYITVLNVFEAHSELLPSETRQGRLSVLLNQAYHGDPFETTVQCEINQIDPYDYD